MVFGVLAAVAAIGMALTGVPSKAQAVDPPGAASEMSSAYGSGCGPHEDHTNVPIPDPGSITRTITIFGCQKSSGTGRLTVDIKHPYRGDISVDLTSPNGTSYRLKSANAGDSADNVYLSVGINTSVINGTWTLRITDNYSFDSGYLDMWGLDFR